MSVETVYRCDVCGAQRGPSNHWFLFGLGEEGFHLYQWNEQETYLGHLCGSECAAKKLNQAIDGWRDRDGK